jgi:hypothetical protein
MSRTMDIELTQFDEREVAELKKRPDLVQRRHGKFLTLKFFISQSLQSLEQRRAEFRQMINLVHQQVPQASLEAIRYDLGSSNI